MTSPPFGKKKLSSSSYFRATLSARGVYPVAMLTRLGQHGRCSLRKHATTTSNSRRASLCSTAAFDASRDRGPVRCIAYGERLGRGKSSGDPPSRDRCSWCLLPMLSELQVYVVIFQSASDVFGASSRRLGCELRGTC